MEVSYDFKKPLNIFTERGQNIILIGTSEKGPYMEPTLVNSPSTASKIYGSFRKGNLVKAFNQAYDKNRDVQIYMMRIGCTPRRLVVQSDTGAFYQKNTHDMIYAEALFLMEIDDYSVDVDEEINESSPYYCRFEKHVVDDEDKLFIVINTMKGIVRYELMSEMTLNDLSRNINKDYRNGIHNIRFTALQRNVLADSIFMEFEDQTFYFDEGDDGTNIDKNNTYLELEIAYEILLGRSVDVVVPVEAYIDDIHPAFLYAGDSYYGEAVYNNKMDYLTLLDTANENKPVTFHEQLIEFCRKQTLLGYMTLGSMGFRPLVRIPEGIAHDNSYITRILDMTSFRRRTGFVYYLNGRYYDKGLYLQPVASEIVYEVEGEEFYDTGYIRYATMLASTYETTTNTKVGDDVALRYELSNQTRSDLSRLGIVTFRNSVRKGLVVQSGVTAAVESSDYHTLANVRMVQLVILALNSVIETARTEEYFGDLLRKVIETRCGEMLLELKNYGVVSEYSLSISWREDGKKGEIVVDLKNKYMIESVQVSSVLGEEGGD